MTYCMPSETLTRLCSQQLPKFRIEVEVGELLSPNVGGWMPLVEAVPTQVTWAQSQLCAVTPQVRVEDAGQCFPKFFSVFRSCSAFTWLYGRITLSSPLPPVPWLAVTNQHHMLLPVNTAVLELQEQGLTLIYPLFYKVLPLTIVRVQSPEYNTSNKSWLR